MSLLSTLALVGAAIVAKLKPDPVEAQINDLKRERDNLQKQLLVALEDAHQWWERCRNWEMRYGQADAERSQLMFALGEERTRRELQLPPPNPLNQAQLNQMHAQMNLQNQQMLASIGLQAQQAFHDFGEFCNCVPSRSQVLPLNQGD
jgi:hypothetical protein